MNLTTHTYILFHDTVDGPTPFYVGESADPAARLKAHRRDAADPLNEKEAYAYLRDHSITAFDMEIVNDKSERELVEELTLAGFRLYNSNAGIGKTAKKQRVVSPYVAANRCAETVMALREASEKSGRRIMLHNSAQQLTKSEVTRARILGAVPTVAELEAFTWKDCPPELMGMKTAKTADRSEYIRWADYTLLISYRKKDREVTCVVKHPTKGQLWANGESWIQNTKRRCLELVTSRWADDVDQWVASYSD